MQPPHPTSFGQVLKHYRNAAGLTQEELAELARLSAKAIGAIECDTRHPRRDTVHALADALKLSERNLALFLKAAQKQMEEPPELPLTLPRMPPPGPRGSRFYTSHDRLTAGGMAINWMVLGRAKYQREHIHCVYDPVPVPLVPDFDRMLKEYVRDWEGRRSRGEVGLPYNSETYKLKRFQVGYRRIVDGEEIPELLLEFGPTDYFTQIITDLNIDNPIRTRYARQANVADQPVQEFSSILGVNLSLITSDNCFIATLRSNQTFVSASSLHLAVGENLLRPKDAGPDGAPDPFYAVARGTLEEMGITLKPEELVFSNFGVTPELCQYSLIGTVRLQQTSAEIEDLRRKGVPKDKWETRQLYLVPFELENMAQFAVDHWEQWFSVGLAGVVMSLLDAGYSSEEVDTAFVRAAAQRGPETLSELSGTLARAEAPRSQWPR